MHKFLLAAILALPMTPAMADITFTGDKGGTISKSRDCVRAEGQATCTTDTAYVGPEGRTGAKTRVRTTVPGASSTEVTLTGPEGNVKTRKRLLTWGD